MDLGHVGKSKGGKVWDGKEIEKSSDTTSNKHSSSETRSTGEQSLWTPSPNLLACDSLNRQ